MNRHILLVEDDPGDEELTLAALEDYHAVDRIFVVRDGEEALDYLYCRCKYEARTTGHPIVVLLDLKMPKINGLEVLKILKADNRMKSIPIVVLTSSREAPDLIEGYRLGANAYVVKPVVFGEFMRAIKQLAGFWTGINEPPLSLPMRETTKVSNE